MAIPYKEVFFLLIEQLQSMIEDLAQTLKKNPGQKLCSSCRKIKTEKHKEAEEAEENNDDKEYLPTPNPEKALKNCIHFRVLSSQICIKM